MCLIPYEPNDKNGAKLFELKGPKEIITIFVKPVT